MADPISIITLAASIIATCYEYGCTAANAPEEAQRLASEVSNLSAVLVGIQGLWANNQAQLDALRLPYALGDCADSLNLVKTRVEIHVPKVGRSKGDRLLGRLLWPLKRGETLELLQIIERQKTTLGLILDNFTSQKVADNQRELQAISSSVSRLHIAQSSGDEAKKSQHVLDWICRYEHQAQHDNACQKHCENTSSWLVESHPFAEWRRSTGSTFWLSGLPGSGKTMLTSFAIEHLLQRATDDGSTVIFFYFDRSTNQSLSVKTFIASTIRQLCTQHGIPNEVRTAFESSQLPTGGTKEPSLRQLQSLLQGAMRQMAQEKRKVFLVIDGLDEAVDPNEICAQLENIAQHSKWTPNVFIASRPMVAVSEMNSHFHLQASVNNVHDDIATYIETRLTTESRLKKMKPELRQTIKEELLKRASGMFRLAQCQLDEVSKSRTDRAVKLALQTLPKTLEASYSRMIERIDPADEDYAGRIFLWLTYSMYPLHLASVAEAAVLEPGVSSIDNESRLSDPKDVLDICGMFLSHNNISDEVRLSHHTVREYLSTAKGSTMYLPEKESHKKMAELCLTYLLMDNFEAPFESPNQLLLALHDYPLLAYSARYWTSHVLESGCEQELEPLISRLFVPETTPRFLMWLQVVLWHSTHGFEGPENSTKSQPTPLYYASSYGLYHTAQSLISRGADLNVRAGRFRGTAYHAACWRQHPEIVRLLLDAGIDTGIRDANGMTAFDLIEYNGFEDVAEVMREYNVGVTQNHVVDSLLKAMYRQEAELNTRAAQKWMVSHFKNRKPPDKYREVAEGSTFEME